MVIIDYDLGFPPWFYHGYTWLWLQCLACCLVAMTSAYILHNRWFFIEMASKKTYSVKEVIERLNREAEDESDDSGDDVDDSEEFDIEQLAFTGDSDDDDRALQEVNDEDDDDDDNEPWSPSVFSWRHAAEELPMMHPFTGQSGFNVDTTDFAPDGYYQLFVTDDLFRHFVIQTNLFAEQYIDQHPNLPPYSNVRQWSPTNVDEMKKFIGLLFVMGVVKKPSLSMYWSTDPLFQMPLFGIIMPRNRFFLLLKFFHVNDNQNIPNRDDPVWVYTKSDQCWMNFLRSFNMPILRDRLWLLTSLSFFGRED